MKKYLILVIFLILLNSFCEMTLSKQTSNSESTGFKSYFYKTKNSYLNQNKKHIDLNKRGRCKNIVFLTIYESKSPPCNKSELS